MSDDDQPPRERDDAPSDADRDEIRDGAADPLEELVFEVLEAWDQEGPAVVERLAAAHPELAERLRARLKALHDAGLLGEPDEGAELPERLGEFRLLQRLGGGGMGVVHRAEQQGLGRVVALKLVRPEQLYFPGARERFRREVEAAARLSHPGIVPVYTVGEERGLPYYAMECVEGASLADVVAALAGRDPAALSGADMQRAVCSLAAARARDADAEDTAGDVDVADGRERAGEATSASQAPAPLGVEPSAVFAGSWVEACLRVARQVAEALEHAHRRGVLHRDVKPSNVMITPQGRAMLLDFGLSSLAGASRLTRTGAQIGSLPYMPPELVSGELDTPGPAQDVYSLGVTLYELLTLRLPFEGDSSEAMRRRIVEARPGSPRRVNRAISGDVETVVAVALELDPRRRFASAEAFARDLSNVLEQRPVEARRPSAFVRGVRWSQRHPAGAAALVLALLLVAGGPLAWAANEARVNEQLGEANDSVKRTNAQLRDALALAEQRRLQAAEESRRAEAEREAADRARAEAVAQFERAEAERARAETERRRAEGERAVAVQAGAEAETERERADDERRRAELERDKAEASFRRALRAVDLMLAQLGEDVLDGVPRVQPVRDALLGHAAELYDELLRERPDDVELASERGRLDRVRGDVRRLMGDLAGAERHYRAAARAYDTLLRGPARGDPLIEMLRAQVDSPLAMVLEEQGFPGEARSVLLEGVSRLVALHARLPGEPIVVHDLAASLTGLALRLREDGQPEDAVLMLEESVRVVRPLAEDPRMEQLLSENTGLPTGILRGALAKSLGLCMLVKAQDLAELDSAARDLAEALALVRGVRRDRPDDPEHATNFLELALNGSELLGFMLGRWDDAEALAREGLRVADELAAAFTDVPEYRKWAPGMRVVLGRIQLELGLRAAPDAPPGEHVLDLSEGHAELDALFAAAVQGWDELARGQPDNLQYAFMAEAARLHGGHASLHRGDLERADAWLELARRRLDALLDGQPGDPRVLRNLFAANCLRAELLAGQGRLDEVDAALDAARAVGDGHPVQRVGIAGVLSTCADAADAADVAADSERAAAWRVQARSELDAAVGGLPRPAMLRAEPHLRGLAGRGLLPEGVLDE